MAESSAPRACWSCLEFGGRFVDTAGVAADDTVDKGGRVVEIVSGGSRSGSATASRASMPTARVRRSTAPGSRSLRGRSSIFDQRRKGLPGGAATGFGVGAVR